MNSKVLNKSMNESFVRFLWTGTYKRLFTIQQDYV